MPAGRASYEVRRRGSNDYGICSAGELDVVERMPFCDEGSVHGSARERFERDRPNELRG